MSIAPPMSKSARQSDASRIEQTLVLGIETSCDDTAAALVSVAKDGSVSVMAETVIRQDTAHAPYGGVVPEIAAREHAAVLDQVVAGVLDAAGNPIPDGIAATSGPGLVGGVMVGLSFAKALAIAWRRPFLGINHLEGHALSVGLSHMLTFPYLLLLVSGGHSQLISVEAVGHYRRLGSTIDDAAGEAFDKTAKLLGLPHPGGPALEALAQGGDPSRFQLPRPLIERDNCDFSFAGLKTATARHLATIGTDGQSRADLAAAFQEAVTDCLIDRTGRALAGSLRPFTALVAAGGVAANRLIRSRLETLAATHGLEFIAPPLRWCTDNAAMIAYAGGLRFLAGEADSLSVGARARWPLDETAAQTAPLIGSGKKGPKA